MYLTDYSLLIVQDLWQANYQILPIIFLKILIKLNVTIDTVINDVKLAELTVNSWTAFFNKQILKMIK